MGSSVQDVIVDAQDGESVVVEMLIGSPGPTGLTGPAGPTGPTATAVTTTVPAALTTSYTVSTAINGYLYLDPNGSTRIVTLPAHSAGQWIVIRNVSTGAFSLTVNDSSAALQVSLAAGMTNLLVDDGTVWRLH